MLQLDRVPSIDYGSKITVLDGTPDSVIEICKVHMIDEVLIFLPRNEHDLIDRLIEELQIIGVTTRVAIDYLSLPGLNKEAGLLFGEIPMLTYSHFSLNSDQLLAKRLLDILGSIVGLMLNLLMFPFIAAAIKLDSPGPVFFGQRRIGEHRRNFTCWKYRTMYLDAEAKKQELMAQNEMNGAMFKITSDPRITRVGRLLRRLSLDEFPQFWNVLTGDMSMVGTRPPTPDEVAVYENWQRKRISIRPGITGLWQISGRSTIRNFDDVVRLDIEYIESWSIWLDIRIILKTPLVIFNQQGAH